MFVLCHCLLRYLLFPFALSLSLSLSLSFFSLLSFSCKRLFDLLELLMWLHVPVPRIVNLLGLWLKQCTEPGSTGLQDSPFSEARALAPDLERRQEKMNFVMNFLTRTSRCMENQEPQIDSTRVYCANAEMKALQKTSKDRVTQNIAECRQETENADPMPGPSLVSHGLTLQRFYWFLIILIIQIMLPCDVCCNMCCQQLPIWFVPTSVRLPRRSLLVYTCIHGQ